MKKLALMLCIAGSLAATNGFRTIGYGTKSKGMGGVGIALPQDAFAAALNPAGLGYVCDRFDIGVQYLRDKGDARIVARISVGTGGSSELTQQNLHTRKDIWWGEAAVNWIYCPCCALGISGYFWGGWKIDYNEKSVLGTPNPSNVFNGFTGTDLGWDYQVYFVTPAWACTLCGDHTFGVSANIAIAALSISGLERFISDGASAFPEYVTDKGTEFQHGLGLHFGWIGQFNCVTLGLAYKTKTWMNHFKKYRGFIAQDGMFDLPSIWSAGVTYCVTPCVVLSLDYERIMWTDAKLFRHDLFNNGRFGSTAGQGFGWEDQSVVKIGGAWDVTEAVTLRAGFNWGSNLYANRDLLLNVETLGSMNRHLTLGLTYYNCCHEFTIDYVHGYHNTLGWKDLSGSTILPCNSAVAGFRNTEAKNRISQDSVGVSYGYHY